MKTPWKTLLVTALTTIALSATASTVGYWRFEAGSGFLSDSSGNGLTLSTQGTAPVQYTLPGTGPGASFDRTIPQTGMANSMGAHIANAAGSFTCADSPSFSVTDFTIEAYVNRTNVPSATTYVASQNVTTGNQRSWAFGVAGSNPPTGLSTGELFVTLSADGVTAVVVGSGLVLEVNTDYYVAASLDTGYMTVTFHLKNLSTNGPLTSATKTSPVSTLKDSNGAFNIGAFNNGINRFPGIIDEVRLSRAVLKMEQLLVNRPGCRLSILTVQPSAVQLTGSGIDGQTYGLLRSTNLSLPSAWQGIGSNVIAGPNGTILFCDTNPPPAAGFYRLRRL
jgi:hypothetical protein